MIRIQVAIKLAEERNIDFTKNILNQKNFFDVVLFRGTIQHLNTPFMFIEQSFEALKTGGVIVFLATPNANSPYYKCFGTLPMLTPKRNFYIPSDTGLTQALKNFGFELLDIQYPYYNSPYSNVLADHIKFILSCFLPKKFKFAFWKSTMNLVAQKV